MLHIHLREADIVALVLQYIHSLIIYLPYNPGLVTHDEHILGSPKAQSKQ